MFPLPTCTIYNSRYIVVKMLNVVANGRSLFRCAFLAKKMASGNEDVNDEADFYLFYTTLTCLKNLKGKLTHSWEISQSVIM